MSTALTLDKAAQRAGVSRWTVSRALQAGRLKGIRDNRGRWRVDPEALDTWAAEQGTVLHDVQNVMHAEQHGATVGQDGSTKSTGEQLEAIRQERDKAQIKAAALQAEATQLRERLDEVRAQMCERLDEAQAQFRERLSEVQGRLEEIQTDRDHWRQFAAGLSEARSKPRLGLLDRLLGRSQPRAV